MANIHDFKNGYKLKISMDNSVYDSLGDYDEYSQAALFGERYSSFGNDLDYFQKLRTYLEEPYEITSTGFKDIKSIWERQVKNLKNTHSFEEPVDFDAIAQHIYKEWWKPLINSHIEYMNQEGDNFVDHMHHMDAALTLRNLEIFKQNPKLLEVVDFSTLTEYDEDQFEELRKEYISILQGFEVKTVQDLDNILDLIILPYFDVEEAESTFMIPDPDLANRINQSTYYAFVEGNPYVTAVIIYSNSYSYWIKSASKEDSYNYLIISGQKDNGESVIKDIQTYLNDEWYSGQLFYVVPDEDQFKYQGRTNYGFDEELGSYVVDLNDSCCGFDSEESVIEHFKYAETTEPPKYKLNFKRLANTQVI